MKYIISKVLRCVAFLLVLASLLMLVSFGFAPKNNLSEDGMDNIEANGILGEKTNTIDVLIVGDSESYSSVSPMQMWNEYGFTSYVCGTPSQKLTLALQFVEQGFKHHSPKVVILETNAIFREYRFSNYILSRAESLFPIFKFHNRWKTMKWHDLCSDITYTWTDIYKGFRYNASIQEADSSQYMHYTDEIQDISNWNLQCLKQIKQICEDNNAQLLLVSTPSTVNWNYAKHNGVQEYAENNGLKYIDMNLMPEEIPIDWKRDTCDKGDHLNYYGAVKVSGYLGKYLKDQYEIADHRNDKEYVQWNHDFNKYQTVTGQS